MTRIRSAQPWSFNVAATQTVRANALNDDDRRELLEALGLVVPGSRVCEPDDVAEHTLVDPGEYAKEGTLRNVPEAPARRKTTPPGLATLPPRQEPPKPSKPPKTGKPKPVPAVTGPKRERARKPIEHGTYRGAQAERRRGIPTCDDCRRAVNVHRRPNSPRNHSAAAKARRAAQAAGVDAWTGEATA